jgi:phosphoglycerate kinase
MAGGFCTLDDVALAGKRVLLRVDLNVPMKNGAVTDATRLERVTPTIAEIADKSGKVILLSHLGRPKGRDPAQSLRPVAAALAALLKRPVGFVEDCIGSAARAAVDAMRPGDIVCLENTRFHEGEESNDPAFVAALAGLGDLWVNDAFSAAHRAHASTEGLGHLLPAYAGRALEAELHALGKALETPEHPVIAIVGGAKISTKLVLLRNLIARVDFLAVGGGMANTFLAAQGKPIGNSLAEPDLAASARDILIEAERRHCEIVLPCDAVVAPSLKAHVSTAVVPIAAVAADAMILDLGPRSVELVISVLARAKTLLWNGPVGAFEVEPFDTATIEIAEAAGELTAAGKLSSIAGGGDTVAALNRAGVTGRFSYVSTAGGAFLEWLEGRTLPGVAILQAKPRNQANAAGAMIG